MIDLTAKAPLHLERADVFPGRRVEPALDELANFRPVQILLLREALAMDLGGLGA
jgi:hypothetical protein